MAEAQKTDKDILLEEACPFSSSPILFVKTKSGDLVSATLCYGCTVIHARPGGTTLYHLSDKTACSGYMSGIAKRSTEGGYDINWGYSSLLTGCTIKQSLNLGYVKTSSRRPRVFDQYHEGGDQERFVFQGMATPKNHAPLGDNLMSLLGIEDADPSPSSPVTPVQTRPNDESASEAKGTPLAPHRRVTTMASDVRSYLATLQH